MNKHTIEVLEHLRRKGMPELATLLELYAKSHGKLAQIKQLIEGRDIVDADEIREILNNGA